MDSAYDASAWIPFFTAEVGAAAALTGLLFVAVSINLDRVVARPRLLARAGETLIGLLLTLAVSAAALVPQGVTALAAELLVAGGGVGVLTLRIQLRHGPDSPGDPGWWFAVRVLTVQAIAVPSAVSGISGLAAVGGGVRWLAAGVVLGLTGAVYSAWVLLVEIVRKDPG